MSIDNFKSYASYFALQIKKSDILSKQYYHLIKVKSDEFSLIFNITI